MARVGGDIIEAETVARIAAAQKLTAEEARARAVHDALLAHEARERGLASHPTVVVTRRGILAEALLRTLMAEAASRPSTPEEIARATAEHWLDLDRPEALGTVHAVVQVKQGDSPQKAREAQELARRIGTAVKGITDPDKFVEAAKAVPSEGFEVTAERLSPVTSDGRVADLEKRPGPGEATPTYDKEFVAYAWRMKHPGEQVGPVQSSFGWHVVMLTAIQSAQRYPAAQLAAMVRDEIVAKRAKFELDRQMEELRRRTPTSVERNALSLMDALLKAPKESE